MCRLGASFIQPVSIHEKDVGETVVVIVKDCDSRARRFHDELFAALRPRDVYACQTSSRRNILVANDRCLHAAGQWPGRNRCAASGHSLCVGGLASAESQTSNRIRKDNATDPGLPARPLVRSYLSYLDHDRSSKLSAATPTDRVVCFASVAFDKYSIIWCCRVRKERNETSQR